MLSNSDRAAEEENWRIDALQIYQSVRIQPVRNPPSAAIFRLKTYFCIEGHYLVRRAAKCGIFARDSTRSATELSNIPNRGNEESAHRQCESEKWILMRMYFLSVFIFAHRYANLRMTRCRSSFSFREKKAWWFKARAWEGGARGERAGGSMRTSSWQWWVLRRRRNRRMIVHR